MSISFNQVPSQIRVPFLYAEFDNAAAVQGLSTQEYRVLMMGQRLATGSQAALDPITVTSEAQAKNLFGEGSMLAEMAAKYLANTDVIPLVCIALDDDGASVASTGIILIGGAVTAAGTLALYVGGKSVKIAVAVGDTPAAVATALNAAITADADMVITSAVNGGTPEQLDFTAKNKGAALNQLDLRLNYFEGEELPTGLTAVITPLADGTTNPDISGVFAAIGETQYILMVNPYTDAANILAMETELDDRFGPIRQNDGYGIYAERDDLSGLGVLGNSKNSQFTSIMGIAGPNSPWEWASATAGQVASAGSIDPARPFQTLALTDILAPSQTEQFTLLERNTLLFDGIATYNVDTGGTVRIERVITTYKTNALGAADESYLDLNTLLTLSFLRFDYRNLILNKYPRHKLANDGTRFSVGQAIVTPKIIKAETIIRFKEWELDGLVEGLPQFKEDLIVERNSNDPNRVDVLLPPDLVNQLRVTGVKIGFLL